MKVTGMCLPENEKCRILIEKKWAQLIGCEIKKLGHFWCKLSKKGGHLVLIGSNLSKNLPFLAKKRQNLWKKILHSNFENKSLGVECSAGP